MIILALKKIYLKGIRILSDPSQSSLEHQHLMQIKFVEWSGESQKLIPKGKIGVMHLIGRFLQPLDPRPESRKAIETDNFNNIKINS